MKIKKTEYKENILVLYSGGMGSFLTAYLLKQEGYNVKLYFNDTYIERDSLYMFMIETLQYFAPISQKTYDWVQNLGSTIPPLQEELARKAHLKKLGAFLSKVYPIFIYDSDGRNVWDVFNDVKFIGNSRIDPCSRVLKRERSHKYIQLLPSNDWDIAIGIDFTEIHRFVKAKPNWEPYNLISPLIDFNISKIEYEKEVLSTTGIERSKSYNMGFSHDNCGGFCVKAGLGHFKTLLENDKDTYSYHEQKEQDAFTKIGRYPFLKKTINKIKYNISLKEYRVFLETGNLVVKDEIIINACITDEDLYDVGGCGCAI